MADNTTSGSKSNNKLWIILFILAAVLNVYQWMDKSSTVENYEAKTDSLSTVNIELEQELGETYAELNQYKGTSEELDSLLNQANQDIEEQQARIEELMRSEKNSKVRNRKLQAELEELKKKRGEYLEQIDQLLVENQKLKKANEELIEQNAEVARNLESTINTASVLRSEYLQSKAFKKRNSGKFVETALAKRTNKMELCLALLDNPIAESGEKTIYLRIVEPGGKTMGSRSEGSSTFTMPATGEVVQYTVSQTVEYSNQREDLCLEYAEDERIFPPGTYAIEVYVDGNLSSSTSHTLK